MKWKVLLGLLAVILLALVSLSPTGEVDRVSAQGLVEYEYDCAGKYDLLWFPTLGWDSEVKGGCVVYQLKESDENPGTPELFIRLSEELRVLLGYEDVEMVPLAYGKGEVVTVCGDTVHFRYLPVSSSQ
jgi:hypothetical protein